MNSTENKFQRAEIRHNS